MWKYSCVLTIYLTYIPFSQLDQHNGDDSPQNHPSICLGLGINMGDLKQDIGVSAEIQTAHLLNTRHKQWNRTIPRNTQGAQKVEFFFMLNLAVHTVTTEL